MIHVYAADAAADDAAIDADTPPFSSLLPLRCRYADATLMMPLMPPDIIFIDTIDAFAMPTPHVNMAAYATAARMNAATMLDSCRYATLRLMRVTCR